MILVDTSIWVDHLNHGDAHLEELLRAGRVLCHPFVIGEVALGYLSRRDAILSGLQNLPRTAVAHEQEVLRFIVHGALFGTGIGYVDAHLLAAVQMTPGALLWTRDQRLMAAAGRLGLAFELTC